MPIADIQQLLAMLRLGSAALPIGAFAYSQGVEAAIAKGWVQTAGEAQSWIIGMLECSVLTHDVPLLVRIREAWQGLGLEELLKLNSRWRAARATFELRDEDRQLGGSLMRLLANQGCVEAGDWLRTGVEASLGAAMGLAGIHWCIEAVALASAYSFSWCEAQVGAVTRLIPLGQTEAQKVLSAAITTAAQQLAAAIARSDEEISSSVMGQTLCSMWHETQYSRLFRS